MSSFSHPKRHRRSWTVLIVVILLVASFIAGIFMSWEASPPMKRVEKLLPSAALTGGNFSSRDNAGLTPNQPRVVGPVSIPVRTQEATVATQVTNTAAQEAQAEAQRRQAEQDFGTGPIIIDGTN